MARLLGTAEPAHHDERQNTWSCHAPCRHPTSPSFDSNFPFDLVRYSRRVDLFSILEGLPKKGSDTNVTLAATCGLFATACIRYAP